MNTMRSKKAVRGAVAIAACAAFAVGIATAAEPAGQFAAYRQYEDIAIPAIKVPTVIEVPFEGQFFERSEFAVTDTASSSVSAEPYLFMRETLVTDAVLAAEAPVSGGSAQAMTDFDMETYAEFGVADGRRTRARINLSSSVPITASGITILLDKYVALPKTVEVRAVGAGGETVVLAEAPMQGQTVRFPETTAAAWAVTFSYGQPLRITDIRLLQDKAPRKSMQAVRFLAQPGHAYRIYFDPDRFAHASVGESGNLADTKGVVRAARPLPQANPAYVIADGDADGIPDVHDNCVSTANPNQEDVDGNGRGDICDDFDRDGVMNGTDNCQDKPNMNQADADGDKIGDICDGEESRVTEKYAWLPWAGMGFAAALLVGLFALMAHGMKKDAGPDVPPVPPISA